MRQTDKVTISIPYFRSLPYIKKSVESLLNQTHKNIIIVIVNDGDTFSPPWVELSEIDDPRLIRYDLRNNWGPYFIHDLVLKSCQTPFFCIHDSDDLSLPQRIELLLDALLKQNADFSFSSENEYQLINNNLTFKGLRWGWPDSLTKGHRFVVETKLDSDFKNRASHHAVFRVNSLLNIGGYYGGFRINYDCLITNSLLMSGRMAFIEQPLYNYYIRNDSLSNSLKTGAHSEIRKRIKHRQGLIYLSAFNHYQSFIAGKISSAYFLNKIRQLHSSNVSAPASVALNNEVKKLSGILASIK